MDPTRIVIVGGGFAGAQLAQSCEKLMDSSVEIVVISRDNHLVFTPMLPEVASRSVSPLHVSVPGRTITKRTRWIEAEVKKVDREAHEIHYQTSFQVNSSLRWTHLVLACGAEANKEALTGANENALPVKTTGDAILLGNEVIERFERAAAEPDQEEQRILLSAVVMGGGFSGVEVAGQINDLMFEMRKSYSSLKGVSPHVTILQHGDRVLPELQHQALSEFTLRQLRKHGIEVRLTTNAKEVTEQGVVLESGEFVPAGLVVTTTGTKPVTLIEDLGLPMEKGRLRTLHDMRVTQAENIWAIGDCAVTTNEFNNLPTSATGQFAIREAMQLAANLKLVLDNCATRSFHFRPQGLLASIGRRNGVAEIYGLQFSGFFAWMLWRAVYLYKLPTLSMKIGVALDWLIAAAFPPPIARLHIEPPLSARRSQFYGSRSTAGASQRGNAGAE
jgi:NADH dehydrogenase